MLFVHVREAQIHQNQKITAQRTAHTACSGDSAAVYIANSAHHLDLRYPNDADPISVTMARQFETDTLSGWLDAYYAQLDAQFALAK
jgi:hypothetical protein